MDLSPSTAYHPASIKFVNRVVRGLNKIGLARIDLSEGALLAEARRQTGLDRFGDEYFLLGLRPLLEDLDRDAALNPFGRLHAKTSILNALKNLLWANAVFEAHPEIESYPMPSPIIVVGPVRSGTTRLQRLLAADTRFAHLTAWEGFNPAPRGGPHEADRLSRREEVRKFLKAGQKINPGAFAAHPMEADAADEEILLLNQTFDGLSYAALYHAPRYREYLLHGDRSAAYRSLGRLLRLVSWARGEPADKPWVLKTPQHMLDLPQLLQAFPDAKLLFTHRDPRKTVASTLSLAWNFSVLNTDRPCRSLIRDAWLEMCEQMARRCIASRAVLPESQQFDVYYDEMNEDWLGVMKKVYAFLSMEYLPAAQTAALEWMSVCQRDNIHGNHRYALDDYGLSQDEVDARMAFYRAKYRIPYEAS
ncbi:MAG TPA: sulfotransferase [Rhodocyclaceae bacterium]|nr:sulfotransferase [Rhodocyclaceae bacterium]